MESDSSEVIKIMRPWISPKLVAVIMLMAFVTEPAVGQAIYTKDILGQGSASSVSTLQSQVTALQTSVAAKADVSAIPAASNVAPNMDGTSSVIGASTLYARADHTHPSIVRKTTLTIAGGAGKATWTFSPAYGAGIVPLCLATVISTAGATVPYVVNIAGAPTNTAVTIVAFKSQATLASLLSTLFQVAENAVQVNVLCTTP